MTYDVLLSGTTLPGADIEQAAAALAEMSGQSPDAARAILSSGKPRLAKRGLTPEAARELADRFASLGIATTLRPGEAAASEKAAGPVSPEKPEEPAEARPAETNEAEEEEPFNPYRAPKADMRARREPGPGRWLDRGKTVPANHGLRWIGETRDIFLARTGVWGTAFLALCALTLGCALLSSFVPPLQAAGGVLGLLWPILGGGMAMTAERQRAGEAVRATHLFDGFNRRTMPLFGIVLWRIAYVSALALLALILAVSPLKTLIRELGALDAARANPEALTDAATELFLNFLAQASPAIGVALILWLPLALGGIFAPTLVALGETTAARGLVRGFAAGVRNWRAFLVNGLALVAALLGLGLAAGVCAAILGKILGEGAGFGLMFLALGLGNLLFSFLCELMGYVAARDIFYEADPPEDPAARPV